MEYDYTIYESATGCVVDCGVCSEDEKDGIKEYWPEEEDYEIEFRPFRNGLAMTAEQEERMQGVWQEQMH